MKKKLTYILCLIILGCSSPSEVCDDLKDVDYLIETYYGNQDKVSHTEYFNAKDQLLRFWRPAEEIINYLYDESDILIEIQYSRNCNSIIDHHYKLYNHQAQLVGEHKSRNLVDNLDTIAFVQTKFYSSDGKLKSELDIRDGQEIEKTYTYINNNLAREFITGKNSSIEEHKSYHYGDNNLLDSIIHRRGELKEVESFYYDSLARLIRKTISSNRILSFSNPKIDAMDVTFDNKNYETILEYKEDGNLTIESRVNNKGNTHLRIIKRKIYEHSKR